MDRQFRHLRLSQLDRTLGEARSLSPRPSGGCIASVREALGLTLAEVGRHLRAPRQTVQEFERMELEDQKPENAGEKNMHVDDNFVVGYVPIGKVMESVPSLLTRPDVSPTKPTKLFPRKEKPEDPTVGRYVVRNDDSNWVANANEFWGGLTAFFGGAFFTNSQYYWAYPFEFNSNESSYVNSVNIALNEVHGDWWFFTTLRNNADWVDFTAIPASQGYGSANGGKLDFWVLHSWEIVPSAMDAPRPADFRPWWTPWFNIFQGVHTVVGYRTIMWIDDDITGPFATSLRFGAPVVSAWFNAGTPSRAFLRPSVLPTRPTLTQMCEK